MSADIIVSKEDAMKITATEFKTNMGKYLDLVSTTVIYITKNGKEVAKLTKPDDDRVSLLNDLVGVLPPDADTDEDTVREERLKRQ